MLADHKLTTDEVLRLAWLAGATAASWWDDVGWDALTRRHLDVARALGALSALPLALHTRAVVHLFTGDLAAATTLIVEVRSVSDVIGGGSRLAPYGEVALLALRGHEEEAEPLIQTCLADALARGEGLGATMAHWARAVLCNALGRYGAALEAATEACAYPFELGPRTWALAELVKAGVRSGRTGTASAALEELSGIARASGTDWALGVEASRRALLQTGTTAEHLYREALERLGRTLVRVDLARVQLLYGEWLRREGRRVDARVQLRTAYESLSAMGLEAFADCARRELLATGETVRRRTPDAFAQLTAQEARTAQLAAEGLTNPEIGAALYISPRTVEWHLRRIFIKLGVSTRRQLKLCLTDPTEASRPGAVNGSPRSRINRT
jgi:DNA-binding CsgD family transcriptional regulator